MKIARYIVLILLLLSHLILVAGCGKNPFISVLSGNTTSIIPGDTTGIILGNGTVFFLIAPLNTDDFSSIIPLGHLSPPSHTFPTDHIYFALSDSSKLSTVYCPADGYVTEVRKGSETDYSITISFTSTFKARFGHMTSIDSSFQALIGQNGDQYIQVKAGQILGTVGGPGMNGVCLDFNVYDMDTTLNFANQSRYSGSEYVHTVCGLDYYQEPTKTDLYRKVNRIGSPLGEKLILTSLEDL